MRVHLAVACVALIACSPVPAPVAAAPTAPPCPAASPSAPTSAQPSPIAASPPSSPSSSPSSSPASPPPPPAALRAALEATAKALAAGDLLGADKPIAVAAGLAGDDAHLGFVVARMRATRFVLAADYERAAAAIVAIMPSLAKHRELPDEFWAHNAMMMIRAAQGDPAAALAENDQATLAAARGTWDPAERDKLALQKDRWHRAYLTRMLAESRSGSVKQALVQYAETALDEYRPIGFPDSIAVLEAYFAALDGKAEAALAAAKRVDPKSDDLEDLYLVVVGLEAGGDRAAAEAVRRTMRRGAGASIASAIMLRWLDMDAKPAATRGFTPWHARSR